MALYRVATLGRRIVRSRRRATGAPAAVPAIASGTLAAGGDGVRLGAAARGDLWAVVTAYVLATVTGEALAAFVGAVPAAILDAAILVVLVDHVVLAKRSRRDAAVLSALALVPLLRLLSLGLAVRDPVTALCASGIPVLAATVLAARELGLVARLGLAAIRTREQCLVAVAGAAAGVVAALLFEPRPLVHDPSWPSLLGACVAVFLFAGVLEELVFRGVVQGAMPAFRARSVLVANVLFTATYLGSGSAGAVVAAAAGGLMSGWWTDRTGSVAGVAVAHGLLAAGYLVLWPTVL